VRDTSAPSCSVGVQFRPGGAAALFACPETSSRSGTRRSRSCGARTPAAHASGSSSAFARGAARALRATAARAATGRARAPSCGRACDRDARRAAGETAIRALCRETGLSHGRLIELFRRAVGLTPRVFARVRRFQRTLEHATRSGCAGWAGVAVASGYCDQSHLIREFRALGGLAPGQYAPIAPDPPEPRAAAPGRRTALTAIPSNRAPPPAR
jgi:AraC-like DNA-binding protein